MIASDTADKAAEFLKHVKGELLQNQRLRQDYPEVCEPDGKSPRAPRWRDHEIITYSKARILAIGYGQNIRGRRAGNLRPDMIILDDVEYRDNTHSADAREKLDDWFHKSIMKAGSSHTQVVMVGTIQHYDSLLARLTNPKLSPTWHSKVYRSVMAWSSSPDLWQQWANILHQRESYKGAQGEAAARAFYEAHRKKMLEGTAVLWPENESYYDLMLMRETEGYAAFDSEKQNEPVDPQSCLFVEGDFQFWDDRYPSENELLASIGKDLAIVGACDPSLGKQGRRGDDSAIITIAKNVRSGQLYVLDADIRKRKPNEIIAAILEFNFRRRYRLFGFEVNQFQSVLADLLREQGNAQSNRVPVKEITNTGDKTARIQRLQPLIHAGTLMFSRRHSLLLDQLRQFPKAAHDDGPDGLEMAVTTADRVRRTTVYPPLRKGRLYETPRIRWG